MKKIIFLLFVLVLTSFSKQENNVDGLALEFKKKSEDYVFGDHYSNLSYAKEGMKFVNLKIVFMNNGSNTCAFNLDDVFISTEKDSLYRTFENFYNMKTKIKPQKKKTERIIFEIPNESKPNELYIEDKKFKIIIE